MRKLGFYSRDKCELRIKFPDVYFSPGYGAACEASDGAEWELAVWDVGPILYPYLKRPLDPGLGVEGCCDVVSPYGYSGIWSPGETSLEEWRAFRRELREVFLERGVIAEFLRISGLVPGVEKLRQADPGMEIIDHNDTVVIDISRGFDLCWASYEGRARTKARKAEKKGYTCEFRLANEDDLTGGSKFRSLYEKTMRRAESSAYYFFGDSYYRKLASGLGERLRMIEVRDREGEVVLSGIFMLWKPFVHLHLVGSEPEANRDGVTNFAYTRLIEWACDQRGYTHLHIGGGMERDDRLFFFKRSFGGERVPFHIGRSVVIPSVYDDLVAARAEITGRAREEVLGGGYFPAYRG